MSVQPLPVILSRPHGGMQTPSEIAHNLAITKQDLYNDCDLWVDELYDFSHSDLANSAPTTAAPNGGPGVLAVTQMPIARALIDVNRPLSSLGHPDGPVKSQTSYGKTIYKTPLSSAVEQQLIKRYWQPYHDHLAQTLYEHAGQVKLVIDCHNMAQRGPSAYADAGRARPLICIANMGDADGAVKPEYGWTLCPSTFARQAVEIAAELFGDLPLLEPDAERPAPAALLNVPFGRSYILAHCLSPEAAATFQRETGHTLPPGIMIEVNRGLLVGDQSSETEMAPPNEARIREIRRRLYQWVGRVLELLDE